MEVGPCVYLLPTDSGALSVVATARCLIIGVHATTVCRSSSGLAIKEIKHIVDSFHQTQIYFGDCLYATPSLHKQAQGAYFASVG